MNDEQLSTLESLYGKGKADVLEGLNLEESNVLQGENRGCWDLKDTVSLLGADFSQTLLYDVSSETLYGISY